MLKFSQPNCGIKKFVPHRCEVFMSFSDGSVHQEEVAEKEPILSLSVCGANGTETLNTLEEVLNKHLAPERINEKSVDKGQYASMSKKKFKRWHGNLWFFFLKGLFWSWFMQIYWPLLFDHFLKKLKKKSIRVKSDQKFLRQKNPQLKIVFGEKKSHNSKLSKLRLDP